VATTLPISSFHITRVYCVFTIAVKVSIMGNWRDWKAAPAGAASPPDRTISKTKQKNPQTEHASDTVRIKIDVATNDTKIHSFIHNINKTLSGFFSASRQPKSCVRVWLRCYATSYTRGATRHHNVINSSLSALRRPLERRLSLIRRFYNNNCDKRAGYL
jgi:hypothetical protein